MHGAKSANDNTKTQKKECLLNCRCSFFAFYQLMKVLKYKYNPNKKGVFRVSIVKNPAVGEGDLVLMSANDAPIVTYADMLVKNNEGKVLILKRNPTCDFEPNKWGFPGGKVMPGETTKEGAVRECFEECGVNVDLSSVKKKAEIVNDDETTSHYFEGTPTNEVKLGNEHQDYSWIDSSDLKDYDLILNNEKRFSNLIEGKILMAAQEIKGVFYAPVMIPDLNIQRIDETTGEKYMVYYDAETVEQLMHNYMKQCGNANTNIEHEQNGIEGVYPVENWIVKDPQNDTSNAIGMPTQKVGTWIQGYKCDSQEVLEKIKNQLLQGLSIEGHLDTEEDTDSPITKFNKHKTMFEKLKEGLGNLLTLMSAEGDPEKEKTAEELAAEEEAKKMAEEKTPEQIAAEAAAEEGEPTDLEKELEMAKATIVELQKKVDDLEAEKAKNENEATLMSAQLEKVEKSFSAYKAVKMSSQKLGDTPKEKVVLTPAQEKQAKFLENVKAKL